MVGFVDGRQTGRLARVHQVPGELGLAIDHDVLAAGELVHVDAVALAAIQHLEAAVNQTLLVHALADAGFVHEVDADLLENAGADAAEHIVAGLPLQDHVVDAGLVQQLAEQQP